MPATNHRGVQILIRFKQAPGGWGADFTLVDKAGYSEEHHGTLSFAQSDLAYRYTLQRARFLVDARGCTPALGTPVLLCPDQSPSSLPACS
jgi:hypothetical protein